jgi:hypothetical protein
MQKSFVLYGMVLAILGLSLIATVTASPRDDMALARGRPVKDTLVVTITNPANGATVSGDTVIQVSVVDPQGIYNSLVATISIDGVIVANANQYVWDTNTVDNGNHDIKAYAEQPRARPKPPATPTVIADDAVITVTVDNYVEPPPSGDGDDIFTGTVSSGADVWHYVDAGLGLLSCDLSWPTGPDVDMYLYRPTDYANYVARAYTTANPEHMESTANEAGQWGIKVAMYSSSATANYELHVTYTPNTPDVTAPTCIITDPANNDVVYKTKYIKVTATDDRQVARVEFFVDGVLKNTDTSTPFSYGWDTTAYADLSVHTLGAIAYDAAGNFATAATVAVTVDQSAAPLVNTIRYAVIVGISDYEAISDLSYCDEDASDWYNYLISIGYLPENIWVFGDGHSNNYPVYNGYATEANVKAALNDMIAIADNDDIINFITSGHGSGDGNGESFLCMWDCDSGEAGEDGSFYDHELAAILGAAISQVHVFIDHCYSGGMGPELMALGNAANIFCTTTCTENGYGYDDSSHYNGMWTYWFLEAGLIGHFGGSIDTTLEDAFNWGAANYPKQPPSGDAPMMFDGNGSFFTL